MTADAKRAGRLANVSNRFWRYGPLIIWAALIFVGSSDLLSASRTSGLLVRLFPSVSESTLGAIQFLIRKGAHFTEYAILAFLAARAFRSSSREFLRVKWFWVSLLLVFVYSLSDEFHQSFVPTRTGSIYDSLIDSAGGLVGLLFVWWRGKPTKGVGQRGAKRRDAIAATVRSGSRP